MAVDGLKVVGMAHNDIVAVAAAFEVSDADTAVEGRADRIADIHLDVDAFMHTAEALAVAVGGCEISGMGHREAGNVDRYAVGHVGIGVAVHEAGFPAFGVDIIFGFFLLAEEGFEIFCGIVDLDAGIALIGEELVVLGEVLSGEAEVSCGSYEPSERDNSGSRKGNWTNNFD